MSANEASGCKEIQGFLAPGVNLVEPNHETNFIVQWGVLTIPPSSDGLKKQTYGYND